MKSNVPASIPSKLEAALAQKCKTVQKSLIQYALSNSRIYPWRESGRSPYEILLAEVILKRTTATAAARVYLSILSQFPTPNHLNNASIDELALALSPIGLQRQRAHSLKKLAEYLVEVEKGIVPNSLERLLRIPGVGNYSSRAVLSFAYGIPAAVVDSNVERILGRVFRDSLPEKPPTPLFQALNDKLLPVKHHREFNFGMLDLGSLICRPTPRCNECPLNRVCDYNLGVQSYSSIKRAGQSGQPGTLVVSSQVRRVRKEKGVSLVELAKRAKVSKLTIIKIESGRSTPKPATIAKLAAALGVNIKDLENAPDGPS